MFAAVSLSQLFKVRGVSCRCIVSLLFQMSQPVDAPAVLPKSLPLYTCESVTLAARCFKLSKIACGFYYRCKDTNIFLKLFFFVVFLTFIYLFTYFYTFANVYHFRVLYIYFYNNYNNNVLLNVDSCIITL